MLFAKLFSVLSRAPCVNGLSDCRAFPKRGIMNAEEYHYLGKFSLDGVVFGAEIPKENLEYIRDDLQFLEDDIIVVTYPKAGKT